MTSEPAAASQTWDTISQRLRESLNASTFANWFGAATPVEQDADRLVVAVPNEFTKTWIEGHFGSLLNAAAAEHDLVLELRVAVAEAVAAARADAAADGADETIDEEGPVASLRGLNPRYTFDLFVIGPSNRFAHAAALAVAESPAQAYNPLFIYGSTGLGKTHLLQAVGQYVAQQHRGLSVRYVTTETVLNEFVDALRDKNTAGFKMRYRTYDVLLVDDIQFIEGKDTLQEEFFHTFNSLYEAGKQIIISSDRQPRELATLEARLKSRFEWGLITDIQPPDLETRIAILRKKVATDRIDVADKDVLTFIADRVTSNIRELEGALTRVIAYASLTGRPITVSVARRGAEGSLPRRQRPLDHHRAGAGGRLRVVRHEPGRPARGQAAPVDRLPPPHRHVPVPGADRPVAAQDRGEVRRPRPLHGDARRPPHRRPDPGGPRRLQRRPGAHRPDQARPVKTTPASMWTACVV